MIDIVIPCHELYDKIEVCLRSIFNGLHDFNRVVLVDDDSSSQGTLEDALGEMFPEVVYIRNKQRTYFSGTVNHGLEHASAKYVLVLNNDTKVVTPDCFNVMRQELEYWGAGLISARMDELMPYGIKKRIRCGGYAFLMERQRLLDLGGLRSDGSYRHFNSDLLLFEQVGDVAISSAIINHDRGSSRKYLPDDIH